MKDKKVKSVLSLVSFGAAAVLVMVLAVKLVGRCIADDGLVDLDATKSTNPDEKLRKNQEVAKALRQKNMFMAPKPKPQPPEEVQAILGTKAMFNNKWYSVGDTVPPGAKLIALKAALVKIVWEGKEKTLFPIHAKTVPAPEKPKQAPKAKSSEKPDKPPEAGPPPSNEQGPSDEEKAREARRAARRARMSEMGERMRSRPSRGPGSMGRPRGERGRNRNRGRR